MSESTQSATDPASTRVHTAASREVPVDEATPMAGQPSIENPPSAGPRNQNPKSKIPNGKRPYVQTPAQRAASLANLDKARAAPKEKIYWPSEKRKAANRANLVKARAARHQELEAVVDRLDIAFPPLREEVESPAPSAPSEEPFLSPRGTAPHSETTQGASPTNPTSERSEIGDSGNPESNPPGPEDDNPTVPGHGGVRRKFWAIGGAHGDDGVSREAADYPALEKAARALLHRRRALLNEVRRERRQVMRLLTQAAERTVAATLEDILSLACSLIAVLAKPRLPGRAKRLTQRIEKLLEAFVEKRYHQAGISWMTELQRMIASIHGVPAPDPAGDGTRARRKAKPKKEAGTDSRKRKKPHPAPAGPDLPHTFKEFQGLVRRAFCAPSAEPEDDAVGQMLDDVARSLWRRLLLFQVKVEYETQQLDQALEEMGHTLPGNDRDLQERCWWIEAALEDPDGEEKLRQDMQDVRQCLGILLRVRWGIDGLRDLQIEWIEGL